MQVAAVHLLGKIAGAVGNNNAAMSCQTLLNYTTDGPVVVCRLLPRLCWARSRAPWATTTRPYHATFSDTQLVGLLLRAGCCGASAGQDWGRRGQLQHAHVTVLAGLPHWWAFVACRLLLCLCWETSQALLAWVCMSWYVLH
jgi:hypothetical protein